MSPFMVETDCRCCQKFGKTGDMWHCKSCWNKWHNGERDQDWLTREEWEKENPQAAAMAKMCTEEGLEAWLKDHLEKHKAIYDHLAKK